MDAIPLARRTRSGIPECIHRGSIAIVRDGVLVGAYGNPFAPVPMRSTAKPFILQPLVSNGAIEKYGLTSKELAVMSSSHNGEDVHRTAVLGILAKVGLSESDLRCGTHELYFDWVKPADSVAEGRIGPLYHNCSGKHAATLMLCTLMGFSLSDYWLPAHPVQQLILRDVAAALQRSADHIVIGVDGCGVPTYTVTLMELARAYQYLLAAPKLARIREAIIDEPYMIAGRDRLETDIVASCGFVAKSGSEGIFCLSIPGDDAGIAIKIEDGSDDAAECVAVEVLDRLGFLAEGKRSAFDRYRFRTILTSTHIPVGRYEPVF